MKYNYDHVQQIKYCQKNLDSSEKNTQNHTHEMKTLKMTKEDNFWIEEVPCGFILVILPVSKCYIVEVFLLPTHFSSLNYKRNSTNSRFGCGRYHSFITVQGIKYSDSMIV